MTREKPRKLVGFGMSRRTQAIAGAAFSTLGIWMIAVGDRGDRAVGLGAVLFFGVGTVASLYMTSAHEARGDSCLSTVVKLKQGPVRSVVIPVRRGRLVAGVVALLAMAGGGLMFTLDDTASSVTKAVMTVCATPFGAGAVFGIVQLVRRRPHLGLAVDGLLVFSVVSVKLIPWGSIADVAETTYFGNGMVGIRTVGGTGHRSTFSRRLTGFDHTIPESTLRVRPGRVVSAIEHFRSTPDDRGALGTPAGAQAVETAMRE